ncbi:MAG: amidohydrolase family protein, partial [Dehalococcoidia bacterium]
LYREKRLEEVGFSADSRKGIFRPSDPELRAKDLDLDGVDAEVIYGLAFGPDRVSDTRARNTVYRIYNEWAADFAKSKPERLATLTCLPYDSPQAAVEELRHGAELGMKGAEIRMDLAKTSIFHRDWDILWSTAAEYNMPISFHLLSLLPRAERPKDKAYGEIYGSIQLTMAQLDGVEHLSTIVLSGACERFPDFRFVLGEAGISWIPYVLDRMDHEAEGIGGLEAKPSDYWHRQGYSTFQKEGIIGDIIHLVGEDKVMWGSDYPHSDSVWPDSQETIEWIFQSIKDAKVQRKVVCENAGKLYGFIK